MKKILFCSYSFPPLGGPRSLRWLNFLKTLEKRGWEIDVLTIRPSKKDSFFDQTLLDELPSSIHVYRSYPGFYYSFLHAWEKPVRGFSKTTLEWLPFGLRKGYSLLRKSNYDLIVSSALPFVGHLVAYFLKKKAGIPWIADYGDPLGFNPLTSKVKRFFGGFIEKHILKSSDGIVVPFEEMKREFLDVYPFLAARNIKAIGQGIPEEIANIPEEDFGNKFVVCYVGSFYADVHEPYQFFQALKDLRRDRKIASDLKVIIAGNTEQKYLQYAKKLGIHDIVRFVGQVSFENAISILKGSSVILYIGGRRDDYHFPSKVLISAASNRPILAIQQSHTDLGAEFIKKNNLGDVVPNETQEIKKVIARLYGLWIKNKLDEAFFHLPQEKYFWRMRGKELEEFIFQFLVEKKA